MELDREVYVPIELFGAFLLWNKLYKYDRIKLVLFFSLFRSFLLLVLLIFRLFFVCCFTDQREGIPIILKKFYSGLVSK